MVRRIRHILYRFLPSINNRWHAKRRKRLQSKWGVDESLECQAEQNRIFWEKVLTYSESLEKAHLELLGKAALGYRNATALTTGLSCKRPDYRLPAKISQALAEKFGPKKVIEKFKEVFLS
jgi:hypothetical protein